MDVKTKIIDEIKRIPPLAIPAYFIGNTMVGYRVYARLVKKYGISDSRIYMVEYKGTGDAYIGSSMLFDAGFIDEKSVLVAPSEAAIKVARLFAYGDICQMTLRQTFAIRKMMRFHGQGILINPLIYDSDPIFYSGVLRHMGGYKKLDFYFLMKVGLYANAGIPQEANIGGINKKRINKRNIDEIKTLYEKYGLKPGRTALLAPYIGGRYFNVPGSVFSYISEILTKKGYTVCTNSSDPEREPVINGTAGVLLDFDELVPFCEYGGLFISGRSGLCDIMAQADCKKIILYDVTFFEGISTWREYFSLEAFGCSGDLTEISWPKERDRLVEIINSL